MIYANRRALLGRVALGSVVAVVVAAAFFVALSMWAFGEPNRQAFQRQANATMKHVVPLPSPLVVVEQWESCGQGADPLCDGVGVLVDDRDSDVAPVELLRRELRGRGWTLESAGQRFTGQRQGAELTVETVESYLNENPVLDSEIEFRAGGRDTRDLAIIWVVPPEVG